MILPTERVADCFISTARPLQFPSLPPPRSAPLIPLVIIIIIPGVHFFSGAPKGATLLTALFLRGQTASRRRNEPPPLKLYFGAAVQLLSLRALISCMHLEEQAWLQLIAVQVCRCQTQRAAALTVCRQRL